MAKVRNKFNVDEELESPFNIKHLTRTFKYIGRYKGKLTLALFLSILSMLISLLVPLLTRYIVDDFIPMGQEGIKWIVITVSGYAGLLVLMLVFNKQRNKLINRSGMNMIADIRHDLFKHLQKLPFDYYDSRPHGKILVRVVNYVNAVADFLSGGIVSVILETISIVVILIFMFSESVQLSWIVLAGVPLFLLFSILQRPSSRRAWQKLSNKNSNLNAYLHESMSGMRVTQSFTREQLNQKIFDDLNSEQFKSAYHGTVLNHMIGPVSFTISMIVVVALYYFGVKWGATVGLLLSITGYSGRFWGPIQRIGRQYNLLIVSLAYLERIFEVIDEPVVIDDEPGAPELPEISGNVKFNDVHFSYDGEVMVLKGIDLDIKAGQSVAFVGQTGSGKTTIVNLISRFYNVTNGTIEIDGSDISKVTIRSLRSQMGIMLQDTFIFSGTIMDNIRYGNLEATDEQIIAAAKAVHAHEFIDQMPNKYNTEVNERGSSLSAGQRQLISFARTLLADPKILILDEATSSIDTKTELLVQEGIKALLKNRTSFIIAHRLSTIKSCDTIYVVHEGKIAEQGNHNQLIEQKGRYHDLCMAQAEEIAEDIG